MAVLSGFVYFDNGNPVSGAAVNYYAAIEGTPSTSLGNTTSNANGFWTFTGVTAGRYDVRVSWDSAAHIRWLKGLATDSVQEATVTVLNINDTSRDHQYIFGVSELTADRTVTLPLLTANDTFVFANFAQTLASKTLTTPTIASFVNATHSHVSAAQGGTAPLSEFIPFDPSLSGAQTTAATATFNGWSAGNMVDAAKRSAPFVGRFQAAPTSVVVLVAWNSGTLAWYTTAGMAAAGEDITTHTDSQGSDGTPNTTGQAVANGIVAVDVTASFTPALANDYFYLDFIRDGDDAADTISASAYVLGLYIVY